MWKYANCVLGQRRSEEVGGQVLQLDDYGCGIGRLNAVDDLECLGPYASRADARYYSPYRRRCHQLCGITLSDTPLRAESADEDQRDSYRL